MERKKYESVHARARACVNVSLPFLTKELGQLSGNKIYVNLNTHTVSFYYTSYINAR